MRSRFDVMITSAVCLTILSAGAAAQYPFGFADVPGGGVDDPVIQVGASVGPNLGRSFRLDEAFANQSYRFDPSTSSFRLHQTLPSIPANASGANQFIRIQFPFDVTRVHFKKSLMKNDASLAATSFLTPNLTITDETGAHVPGIATTNGENVFERAIDNQPGFPAWLNAQGQNQLLGKRVFTYIASTGDQDVNTLSAFGGSAAAPQTSNLQEIRVRLHEIGGIVINGFWVLRVGSGANPPPPTLTAITPTLPKTPPLFEDGKLVVEPFTSFIVDYSEPVVPESVGFSAEQITDLNAVNPPIPWLYNGNAAPIPNPEHLSIAIFPNFRIAAGGPSVPTLSMPFDVRPINPNNYASYRVIPLIDLTSHSDVTLAGLAVSQNPPGGFVKSAATSLYDVAFDDTTAAASATFRVGSGGVLTNVTVSPQTIYFASSDGDGIGAVNLDGNGFETNDPSTDRLLILTNNMQVAACPLGSFLLGCNQNTFGDATAQNPIGIGGNPIALGGPTPVPGVNEGSTGSTASPVFAPFPPGFETLSRDSLGDARLVAAHTGSVGDASVGDFLDKVFFDGLNPWVGLGAHRSAVVPGLVVAQNSISDPPVPNPPPLRLPVGLPPVEAVFQQQAPTVPAFVIAGDEVWSNSDDPRARVLLLPNPLSPLAGDRLPTFAKNGPSFQTFSAPVEYAARQQIGNFLYLTDRDNDVVTVVNSNRMSVLDTIELPDPEQIAISPNQKQLYVTNFGDDSLSIVDTDPWSPFFHQEVNRLATGAGPRAVAAQPDNEDILVGNLLGDSVSIFVAPSQMLRKTLTQNVKRPWDIVATPRHVLTGFQSAVYFAFIGNLGTGDVVVYESGPSGLGADDVRWKVEAPAPFLDPRGMTYDPGTYPGSTTPLPGGIFLTHRDPSTGAAMVSRIAWTTQLPAGGIVAPGTPGLDRKFQIVLQWGGAANPINPGTDQTPQDVVLADFNTTDFFSYAPTAEQTNLGVIATTPSSSSLGANNRHPYRLTGPTVVPAWRPDRMYVSFPLDQRILVLDPSSSGVVLNSIDGAPGPGTLATFFDS